MAKTILQFRNKQGNPEEIQGEVFESNGVKMFLVKERYWMVFDFKTGMRLVQHAKTKQESINIIEAFLKGKNRSEAMIKLRNVWSTYSFLNK